MFLLVCRGDEAFDFVTCFCWSWFRKEAFDYLTRFFCRRRVEEPFDISSVFLCCCSSWWRDDPFYFLACCFDVGVRQKSRTTFLTSFCWSWCVWQKSRFDVGVGQKSRLTFKRAFAGLGAQGRRAVFPF